METRVWAPAALLVVAVALPVRADIYRCTDGDGQVHFTSTRSPKMRCEVAVRERKKAKSQGGDTKAAKTAKAAKAAKVRAAARSGEKTDAPDRAARGRMYDKYLAQAARLYQLPKAFLRAVVRVESAFNPQVVSRVGAMGLMQLMPRTATAMGVRNPFDPRQNIFGGTRYLRVLANKFNGDLVLTVAAYNAGEGAVARYRGVPPYAETRRYVRRVLSHYYTYRQRGL
ncbi:MAG: transglycosylase SLT domain-containing protein [Myxococcota bacterium]